MVTPIRRGELAALLPLLDGEERVWCELSSAGEPRQLVYADSEMLSRCRTIASSLHESTESNSDDEFQGQSGPGVATDSDAGSSEEEP